MTARFVAVVLALAILGVALLAVGLAVGSTAGLIAQAVGVGVLAVGFAVAYHRHITLRRGRPGWRRYL